MKTAVIGAGRMGRRHIQIVRDLGLDLAGVCDSSADALASAQKEQHVPAAAVFTDARKLLTQLRPECVIIATTAPTHCQYTCAAAEAGARHILCEKPMAVSLDECDEMIEACARYGAKLAINHQMRFMEQYIVPKRLLNSASFGGLSSVTVIAGNFGLAMNGSHYFEMFRFMADEEPDEVTAWFSPERVANPRGPQFEDAGGCIRITTATKKRFYMDCSTNQGHGMRVIYAAPYGQIYVDELTGFLSAASREEQYRNLPTTRYGMPATEYAERITPADAFAPSRAVLQALLGGGNAPTGEQGRLAVRSLVAAFLSSEGGARSVKLSETSCAKKRRFPWA